MKTFKAVLSVLLILSFVLAAVGCQGNYGGAYGPTGRAATITIAATDSTPLEKSQADYVCSANASTAWAAAIAAAPTKGCGIIVYSGTYNFVSSVNVTKAMSIRGQGYNTYFKYNGSSAVFITGSNNCSFENLRTDAGGINFGSTTGWSLENVIVGSTWYLLKDATTVITATGVNSSISASNITSGLIDTARLGTGAASSSVFLAGDGTWKTSSSGVGVYGDGSDGAVTISVNTTLTKDMYYSSLTINAGITLIPNGKKIFCSGTLTNNGIIDASGGNGGAASSGVGGTAGVAGVGGSAGSGIRTRPLS